MRRIASFLAAVAASVALSSNPAATSAAPGISSATSSHPYFDDKGTLAWFVDLGSALESARASGKLVFIEYGRKACSNCKTLVSRVLPAPRIRSRISDACVGLAADCDDPDPKVEAVFRQAMPEASLLPFVAVVSPDLEYVTGWQGSVDIDGCCGQLAKAEAYRANCAKKACPARQPVSVPAPSAVPASAVRPSPTTARPNRPATPEGMSGPEAASLAASRELLRQADGASKAGEYAEVLRLDREAAGLPVRVDPAAWAVVLAKADAWADGVLAQAASSATAGRLVEAERLVAGIRRDAAGRGASIDAERGARAIATRRAVDATPVADRARASAAARTAFRGTRWEALFGA